MLWLSAGVVQYFCLGRTLRVWLGGLGAAILTTGSAQAAESLYIDYGPLSRSIPVDSLATFVADGTVDEHLAYYYDLLPPDIQSELRTILGTSPSPVDPVAVSQFLYSSIGERALDNAGRVVQTEARLSGANAVRSAIILTATETNGLALLDLLQAFPTDEVHIDMTRLIEGIREVQDEVDLTLALVEQVEETSEALAAQPPPVDFVSLADLTQPGPYQTRHLELTLEDASRNRTYPADLYLPQPLTAIRGKIPVVVLSHGLGDTRVRFREFASHLASYGIAAALPEHIGSNAGQKEAMRQGLEQEVFQTEEFLDRPLDISFLLDELERRNAREWRGKLNLQQVGVAGHSFGGYTALALAGATIDFPRLEQRCNADRFIVLDAAMLLECQALQLMADPALVQRLGETGVRDPRVQLVLAYTPVTNLFGERGVSRVQVPTLIFGGAFDIVAPVVPQQLAAFSWLTTSEKYLYVGENTSHTGGLTQIMGKIFHIDQGFDQGLEEGVAWTQGVIKGLMVAFVQVYLAGDEAYRPYLRSAYIEAIAQDPFKIHLVRDIPPEMLEREETAQ